MACTICIATWSLNTHQIWPLSGEPFLIYSPAANFDTFTRHALHARVPPKWAKSGCKQLWLNSHTTLWRPRVNRTLSFFDIRFSETSPLPAGKPSAHAQISPLFKKELRSVLRAPLVTNFTSRFLYLRLYACALAEGIHKLFSCFELSEINSLYPSETCSLQLISCLFFASTREHIYVQRFSFGLLYLSVI